MSTTPRPIKKINFVELNAKTNTLGSLDIVFPKYGTPLLAARLRDLGYDVTVYLEGVSDMSLSKIAACDLVCMPVYAPTLNKVRSYAERLRETHPGLPIVTGGPQVCFFPDTVVEFSDVAVRCEGDEVLPEIVERLSNGRRTDDVAGVSYTIGDEIVHNPEPPPPAVPSTIPDLELIEGFDRILASPMARSRIVNSLQTSRGCKFRCTFCPTLKLFQGNYRNRDVDSVIADIKRRKKYSDLFFVVDNDFCSSKANTRELLYRLIAEDLDLGLTIFERHEIGRDHDMLRLLRRAGVRTLIVGIESLRDESLKVYNKRQTREAVLQSIDAIRDHGMHVLSTFVIGCDEDTPGTAAELIDFIKRTQLSLNLFIVHDLEVDPQKKLMIPLERRFMTHWDKTAPGDTVFWDYMTGNFVSYFPKRMKPSTLQRAVSTINAEVFSHQNILRNVFAKNLFQSLFSVNFGYGMKRINDQIDAIAQDYYIGYLEELEEGLYDRNEVLMEDRLAKLDGLPLPKPLAEHVDTQSYETHSLLASIPGLARFGAAKVGQSVAKKLYEACRT
jgi:hypothetical protein